MISLEIQVAQLIHRDDFFRDRGSRFMLKAKAGEFHSTPHECNKLGADADRLRAAWTAHHREFSPKQLTKLLQQYQQSVGVSERVSTVEERGGSLRQECQQIRKSLCAVAAKLEATTLNLNHALLLRTYMLLFEHSLNALSQQLDVLIKYAESIKPDAATTICCWWRRRRCFRQHRSASFIQQWLRPILHQIRVRNYHAATSIQVWRRYIVNRRKKAKLAAAALSCAFRERGQPLPPRSRRTRYRQKQRAEGKRRSKRYRPSRKSGQQRGRPPNSVQQQTSQSSVQRREIVLGKAHHIQCDLSSRGNSIGKALHLNNRVSSCRGNDIGKALTDSITVSSSRGELDKPSTHRHLDPTSSDENKPRRRRRRRKTRNPSGIGKRGGVSASKCHTQGANYSPPASKLPRKSELRDMFRLQFQQAAPDDRSLLINLMFEVLKEAVESLHHPRPSPPVPEELIEEPSSVCSSTSDNGDPSVPSSSSSLVEPSSLTFCSSLSSESDASSSTSVVDSQSSSTSASHLSVANKSGSSTPFLLEVLRSPSSHKSVDTPPPSSTTLLVESQPSSSAITEEITDRRQQLNYLQALLGKAPNIG